MNDISTKNFIIVSRDVFFKHVADLNYNISSIGDEYPSIIIFTIKYTKDVVGIIKPYTRSKKYFINKEIIKK